MGQRKFKLAFFFILVVAVPILVTSLVTNLRYVVIGANKIPIDSTDIAIDCRGSKIGKSLKRLKRIPQIKLLDLYGVSEDDSLDHINSANISDALIIGFSDINNSLFVNSLGDIDLLFFQTNIDFQGVSSETHIDSLQLLSCKISNLEEIGKCRSVKKLEFNECNINGSNEMTGDQFNSRILSGFDHVDSLKISGMEITDITGFLNMKSLSSLQIDKECITEEQVTELQEAGISVEMN